MFHQSRKRARAAMGATGLLALLFLLAACGSVSPRLLSNSLQDAAPPPTHRGALAGYITTASGTYTAVQVTFYVPTLTQTVDGAKVAYGAEIGAPVPGAALIDGGIYSYLDPTSGTQMNKAYWEFSKDNSGTMTPSLDKTGEFSLTGPGGGVVHPGDQIMVSVKVGTFVNGTGDTFIADIFTVTDVTTGDTYPLVLPGNDFTPDLSAAGCLVMSQASTPTPLANFGSVDMLGCQVTVSNPNVPDFGVDTGTSATSPIGNFRPQAYQMLHLESDNQFHDATSLPYPLDPSGSFRVDWQNS